jgi:hypothetical protein
VRRKLLRAVLLGAAIVSGAALAQLFAPDDLSPGGLAVGLLMALGTLVVAIAQLAHPQGKGHAVLAGAIDLFAAAAVAISVSVVYEGTSPHDAFWWGLAGAGAGLGIFNGVGYLRALRSRRPAATGRAELDRGELPPSIDHETVEVVFEAVQHLLDAEDTRAQSLNARAVGLGGFAALIVALLVPAARDLGDPQGSDPGTASVVLLVAAATLLVGAAAATLLGVVATRHITTISVDEVKLWETRQFVERSPTWVRGRLLVTLRKALVSERRANTQKARWLSTAVALITGGVLCAAAGGLTLLL